MINPPEVSYKDYCIESEDCIEYLDGVKEELASNSKQIFFENDTAKCGEVMVGYQGEFTFICGLCKQHFIDLRSFGSHIRDLHLNQNTLSTIGVDRGRDPLCEEKSVIPVSLQPEVILEVLPLLPTSLPSPIQRKVEMVIIDAVASSDCKVDEGSQHTGSSREENLLVAISPNPSKVRKFACTICGCRYQAKSSYRRHMRKTHFPVPVSDKITCKYCDKEFDDKEQLQTHISIHTGTSRFVCPFCPKAFNSRRRRQTHVNTHTGERPFQCSHCPKNFGNPYILANHERAHLNIKKFSCRYCDRRFVQSQQKKSHERSHTREKTYQCEECGKRFLSIVGLTGHGRRHKNIKPYACKVCSKAFYTSSRLKEHSVVHSNERPYHCNVCGKNYRGRKALRSHMELHSSEKNYICDICGKAFFRRNGFCVHRKSHGEKF